MSTILHSFDSRSNSNVTHNIIRGNDGIVYCTCSGWQNRKTCYHLDTFLSYPGVHIYQKGFAFIPGDIVKITDTGGMYSSYKEMASFLRSVAWMAERYPSTEQIESHEFRIKAIASHDRSNQCIVANCRDLSSAKRSVALIEDLTLKGAEEYLFAINSLTFLRNDSSPSLPAEKKVDIFNMTKTQYAQFKKEKEILHEVR